MWVACAHTHRVWRCSAQCAHVEGGVCQSITHAHTHVWIPLIVNARNILSIKNAACRIAINHPAEAHGRKKHTIDNQINLRRLRGTGSPHSAHSHININTSTCTSARAHARQCVDLEPHTTTDHLIRHHMSARDIRSSSNSHWQQPATHDTRRTHIRRRLCAAYCGDFLMQPINFHQTSTRRACMQCVCVCPCFSHSHSICMCVFVHHRRRRRRRHKLHTGTHTLLRLTFRFGTQNCHARFG